MLDIIVQQNMALRYTGLRHTALCNKERFFFFLLKIVDCSTQQS